MPEDATHQENERGEPPWFPEKAFKLEQTRLRPQALNELLLKLLYTRGTLRGLELARALCLPWPLLEPRLLELKQQRLCAVVGGAGVGGYEGMDYGLTEAGRGRGAEILAVRPYVGPAPVDLDEYVDSVERQATGRLAASPERLRQALAEMEIEPELVDQLGAALASGGPLLLYGQPGNGKTMLARHLARLLRGRGIFVPHAISVGDAEIRFLDERVHVPLEPEEEGAEAYRAVSNKVDSRWVFVRRPFVVAGGELDLGMLDLVYRESIKVLEAPFQLKANGGMLLIDDLGRQRVEPEKFLNRWIYPLEHGVDYLTLASGRKIQVPFRPLLLFSTNLEPTALADEAFWRRIRYKLQLPDPDAAAFRRLFEAECQRAGLTFDDPAFVHLIKQHYAASERSRRACHPRDLIGHMLDDATYRGLEPRMTDALVDRACATYFVD